MLIPPDGFTRSGMEIETNASIKIPFNQTVKVIRDARFNVPFTHTWSEQIYGECRWRRRGKLRNALSWGLGAPAHFDQHYASIIALLARQQRNFWVQRGPLLSLHMNFSPLPTVGAQW